MADTTEIIKGCLLDCERELAGREPRVARALSEALRRLGMSMQVAVIGRLCSSKSTLVNALLGDEEVAKTDKSEETFNVSLIKYGEADGEVTIVTRDGARIKTSRENLREWTGRNGRFADNPDISHIEVAVKNEFLKKVNIIDTPGLDSTYGKDSENTVRFLTQAQPDAVIMLFTKSINADTLETLREFQKKLCTGDYSLSPMNALGVMAKVDELWKIMDAGTSPMQKGERVIDSLTQSNPDLLHTFRSLHPISALMAMGANRLDAKDMEALKKLAALPQQFKIMTFASAQGFLRESKSVDLSVAERSRLLDKLGLYGVFAAADYVGRKPDAVAGEVRAFLLKESGMDSLKDMITTHFGKRAAVIKSRNAVAGVLNTIRSVKTRGTDTATASLLDSISGKLSAAIQDVREYDLWDVLTKVYEKKLEIPDQAAVAHLRLLAGENGTSAPERLDAPVGATPEELIHIAREKSRFWAKRYIFCRLRNLKDTSSVYRLLAQTFGELAAEIESCLRKIEEAQKLIGECKRFLCN